jgi:hypothetical protein
MNKLNRRARAAKPTHHQHHAILNPRYGSGEIGHCLVHCLVLSAGPNSMFAIGNQRTEMKW